MQDFAAIDFETANNERSSVCSVGIVIVREGEIVDTFYSLVVSFLIRRTTNCKPLPKPAGTASKTTTMPLPMQKHVLG